MLKKENSVLNIDINNWPRPCDICRSAACTLYCRADFAYFCTGCDARIHAANRMASRHERVFVCEACKRAPAAFLCKADSASLCAACDTDIHSANPLARRHHRVPIPPISGESYAEKELDQDSVFETIDEEDADEAASWLLLNPVKNSNNNNGGFFSYGGEAMDEYLDLVDYSTCQDSQYTDQYSDQNQQYNCYPQKGYGGDSVVPVKSEMKSQIQQENHNYQFGVEYDMMKTRYGSPSSICHSVSVSSMDVGVVPESTTSDVSISHPQPPKGTIDLFSSPPIQMPTQLTPMDRKARVLRYREKKKTRKFEKTIRYASRKAYAETRPRIKGRFAKRTNLEVEVDQMFSMSVLTEGGYGIVPSY